MQQHTSIASNPENVGENELKCSFREVKRTNGPLGNEDITLNRNLRSKPTSGRFETIFRSEFIAICSIRIIAPSAKQDAHKNIQEKRF